MEAIGGEVVNIAQTGITSLWLYICEKLRLSRELDDYYDNLQANTDKLSALKGLKEDEVKRSKRKERTRIYDKWINKVQKIIEEVESLRGKYEKVRRLSRWRYLRRADLSEQLLKKNGEVDTLIAEGQQSRDFMTDKSSERVIKFLDVPEINEFPTLQVPLDEILRSLKNDKVKRIGLRGSVGVGKTTVMHNLNNHDEVARLFQFVIYVRVTLNQTVEKLQTEIAERLKIDIEGIKSVQKVSEMIHDELSYKRCLLLLDDVTREINLDKVGIPSNNIAISKVVLAARDPFICRHNNVNKLITVQLLSDKEAWKMFHDMVDEVIDLPGIQPIALKVCKWCARLPLLIKTVATSFKSKESASSWRSGLRNLQLWPKLQNQGLKEIYSILKFCYDDLKDWRKQKCFLFNMLYPEETKIYRDVLVESWIAQGFVGDMDDDDTRMYHHARDDAVGILEELINTSFLEKGDRRMMYVKMNGFIRQFAMYISSEEYKSCEYYVKTKVSAYDGLSSSDQSEALQKALYVSMIHCDLRELPRPHDYSKTLRTLLLQKNPELTTIPQLFFLNMRNLQLLDLHATKIEKLPSSLSYLTNLKALYLNGCRSLVELPREMEELKSLQVLDTRDTGLAFLSPYIRSLVHLRCLRVSYLKSNGVGTQNEDPDGERGQDHVISNLLKLEELVIEVTEEHSYKDWCNEVESISQQVASLEILSTLRFCFPNTNILKSFMDKRKSMEGEDALFSFQFFIGSFYLKHPEILESFDYEIPRYLRYCNGDQKDDLKISEIFSETDAIEIIEHGAIKSLSKFVGISNTKHLRGCLIEGCDNISIVIDDHHDHRNCILPKLEKLYLKTLVHLQYVFNGASMHSGTLCRLQTLVLTKCPNLRTIFKDGAIRPLLELQNLKIQECNEMKEIITVSNLTSADLFPKLQTLVLIKLPKLAVISMNKSLAWCSLEMLKIFACPQLKTLPFAEKNASNLRIIEGEQMWWSSLLWSQNQEKERLQPKFNASSEY